MKTKNYIILAIIFVITILSTLYFCRIYSNSLVNVDESTIGDVLIDVTGSSYDALYNNIVNFGKENHDYIVYVASYKTTDISALENNLRKAVVDGSFKNIVYINVDALKKYDYINRFVSEFSNDSISRIERSDLPVFICFRNEKIDKAVSIMNMDEKSLESILVDYND